MTLSMEQVSEVGKGGATHCGGSATFGFFKRAFRNFNPADDIRPHERRSDQGVFSDGA